MELRRIVMVFTLYCIAATLATDNQDYLEMTGQKGQVTVGSAFYLQCKNVQPDKMNNLRWIYRDENGEEITLNRKFRGIRVISFGENDRIQLSAGSAELKQTGRYICRGDLTNVSSTSPKPFDVTTNIVVKVAPFITSPSEQSFIEGENAEVMCDYKHDAKQDWIGVEEDARFVKEDRKLIISNISESDERVYECQITSEDTKIYRFLSINVTVNYAPKNVEIVGPNDLVQDQEENVVLECNAVGKPSPSIVWMKGEEVLENKNSSSLVISNPIWSDTGVYKCIAKNKVDKVVSKGHKLNVKILPSIYNSSAPPCVEGESTSVSAKVEAFPGPDNLTISFDGNTIQSSFTKLTETTYVTKYEIGDCDRSQAGVYTVDVNSNDTSTDLTLSVTYPPNNKNVTKEACLDDKITLSCDVDADPVPHAYNWTKNGTTFDFGQKIQVSISSDDDYTTYTCKAENSHGLGIVTYDVIRPKQPSPVNSLQVTKTTSRRCYVSYNYSGNKDGGFKYRVTHYQVEDGVQSGENATLWVEKNDVMLENLKYNSTYQIEVATSKCKTTFSEISNITCTTKELKHPLSINITVDSEQDDCDEKLCVKWVFPDVESKDEIKTITIVYKEQVAKDVESPKKVAKKQLKMTRYTHQKEFDDGYVAIKEGIAANTKYSWHAIFENEIGEQRTKKFEYLVIKQDSPSSSAPTTKPIMTSKNPTFVPFIVAAIAVVALLAG